MCLKSNEEFLAKIVSRATFLSETVSTARAKQSKTYPNNTVQDRLKRWLHTAAREDHQAFQNRFRWDDLKPSEIENVLTEPPTRGAIPSWVNVLDLIMQRARVRNIGSRKSTNGPVTIDRTVSLDGIVPDSPIAFEHALTPVLDVARELLCWRLNMNLSSLTKSNESILSESAYSSLERSLTSRLSYLTARALGAEFSRFRPAGLNLAGVLEIDADDTEHSYYDAFVSQLLSDGYRSLFDRYPVLARLMGVAVENWVDNSALFLKRISTDLPALADDLNWSIGRIPFKNFTSRIRVESLEADLSDPHDRGKTVMCINLNNGQRLIYKPKTLRLEANYYSFLRWCNSNGVALDFGIAEVRDMGNYGWMEYLENDKCIDTGAVERFYFRSGMLLFVLYILGATDCHYENVVANGEFPMLVDAETLLHPEARPSTGQEEKARFDSVLRTGMLPHWECWADTSILRDASSLGSVNPEGLPSPVWHKVNTDEMYLVWKSEEAPRQKHMPICEGITVRPEEYTEFIVDGYRSMAQFFLTNRYKILHEHGALSIFKDLPVRFIFRPTNIYYRILRSALSPEYLSSGIDWGIELEQLAYAFLADEEKPLGWQLLALETHSLENLDIPYFIANSSSTVFVGSNAQSEKLFRESSYEQAVVRVQRLNMDQVERQIEIVLGAFQAKQIVLHYAPEDSQRDLTHAHADSSESERSLDDDTLLSAEDFVTNAVLIGEELERRAIEIGRDNLNWLGWSYLPDGSHLQLDLVGHSLYDGRCGIALFFAALFSRTGVIRYRDIVERTVSVFAELLGSPNSTRTRRWVRNMGIGGIGGFGSVIYVLTKLARLLNEPALLKLAVQAAVLLKSEDLESDEQYDIINGSAGALLSLLALYNATEEQNILRLAEQCGHILQERRIVVSAGIAGWRSRSAEKPLTGFSHGAAGVSHALLQLYKATRKQTYFEVATEGLAYERSTFSKAKSNWPDFRRFDPQDERLAFSCSWCHGAPGIALARLGSVSVLDQPLIREEIQIGVSKSLQILNDKPLPVDHVCCGNFGLVELLEVAGSILEDDSLRQTAKMHASDLCQKAKRLGSFRLLPTDQSGQTFFSPTFFQGMAGIGYELLRLSAPDALPCVLLLA